VEYNFVLQEQFIVHWTLAFAFAFRRRRSNPKEAFSSGMFRILPVTAAAAAVAEWVLLLW
jgi:hypothetical protein